MNCPKCDTEISESHQGYDPSCGIMTGGWYCDACDLAVADWEMDYDIHER